MCGQSTGVVRVLFVHQSFPAQLGHVAIRLARRRGWECSFVSRDEPGLVEGVRKIQYRPDGGASERTHYFARTFENAVAHAAGVHDAVGPLRDELRPDLIVGHSGFGSTLFLPELFPETPIVGYFEYFYRPHDSDLDFRPDFPPFPEDVLRARARNAMIMLDLENCAAGYTPTEFQRGLFPAAYAPKLRVVHDGIDTGFWRPRGGRSQLLTRLGLEQDALVLTYVSRGLEAMRGFDVFMRAAKRICDDHPKVVCLVVGEDTVAYGGDLRHVDAPSFKEHVLAQDDYDRSRIRFLGRVPPTTLRDVLGVSDVHVYLTVPFVLSWSLLDAMACGCTVLASDTAPVREVIRHGENGLLSDFFDDERLAASALEALSDPGLRTRLGLAAVETIRREYALEVTLPRLQKFLEEVAGLEAPTAGRPRAARSLATAATALAFLALGPAAAHAGVGATVSSGTLSITTSSGDDFDVTCAGGNVRVGGADPAGGAVACSSITGIDVDGDPGSNHIDLSAVTSGNGFSGGPKATVAAGSGADTVLGTAFDDVLTGGGGVDSLDGNEGTDRLVESVADVTLTDTALGSDAITEFEQASLSGGAGNDGISAAGFSGTVTLRGGSGADTLTGGPGNDTLDGQSGADRVTASADQSFTLAPSQLTGVGTDSLASIEQAVLAGGPGANALTAAGFTGPVTLSGGDGNDTLTGGSGSDSLDGGPGTDRVAASGDVGMTLSTSILSGIGTDALSGIDEAVLTGGAGPNTLDASAFPGPTTLDGGGGNDAVTGGSGPDTITGGPGNDTLAGGDGTDRLVESASASFNLTSTSLAGNGTDALGGIDEAALTGGAGNDAITATSFTGPVTLDGGAGDDALAGGPAADSLLGNAGNDTLSGGAGDDMLAGGDGTDRLSEAADANLALTNTALAGAGNDALDSIKEAQLIGGNSGNLLNAAAFTGATTLDGAAGDDTLTAGPGNDTLVGGPGTDRLSESADASFTLSAGSLVSPATGTDSLGGIETAALTAGPSSNLLAASGFPGRVTLDGGAGNDTLGGGAASDSLLGGSGDDVLTGGGGNDTIMGADGSDLLVESVSASFRLTSTGMTGAGRDSLSGIDRARLRGTSGPDRLDARGFAGAVTLDSGAGRDTVIGSAGPDLLVGRGGNDYVSGRSGNDRIDGALGSDTLVGGAGNDTITGSGGNDRISGNGGSDRLLGGKGRDTLVGGPGRDVLRGGSGRNRLVQRYQAEP
jgi:Ca2+-binding RTX toxin-like protein/glycosyltransferase involved in cell wall biosynthesis